MTAYFKNEAPELWEKAKIHILDWKEDEDGEPIFPIICKGCGKSAVMKTNMSWVCPEVYDIADKYFHAG